MTLELKRKVIIFFAVLLVAVVFLLPTIFRDVFKQGRWISKPISLGRDLSGGVSLVYEVQTREAVKSRLQSAANAIRADLRERKAAVTRARVNEAGELELTFLTDRAKGIAREAIQDEYRELVFGKEGMDGERPTLTYGYSPSYAAEIEKEAVEQAIETLRNRVDQFGVAEPLIQKVGEKRILLQMPGMSEVDQVKRVIGSVAKLEFRLVPESNSTGDRVSLKQKDKSGTIELEDPPVMTGDSVADAQVVNPQGHWEITLKMTSEGAKLFHKVTSDNVHRQLAIVLDNVVYSAPEIQESIAGGLASITGKFSLQEARELKIVLKAGALPAPLEVMEERIVGPTLGRESIRSGILACLIGSAFVFIFMIVYYKKAGLVAMGSLVLNGILIVACLSAFGATLTLPGLAGLALTIGMAVDSNVIIFERIRDEMRRGSDRDAAIAGGFEKAYSALIDSNMTTLLSGLILYYFGTGPIRGFAVTLSIGIVTTIYCAIFVSRLAMEYFDLRNSAGKISI